RFLLYVSNIFAILIKYSEQRYTIPMTSNNDTDRSKRGDPSQIPKGEDVPAGVQKVVSEEAGVEGQRKEVNVESYSKAASLGQILKDLDFPANKDKIIQFVKQKNTGDEILSSLQNIEDKQYQNVSDVTKAAGLVY
ncbi:MAG: DUF2795 domain-containing protein, partial [Nitrososphaeraceae archaeon]